MREHESWSVYLGEQGRGDDPPRWLRRWRGDGVIARIENDRIASAVVESGLPAVDVSAARKVAAAAVGRDRRPRDRRGRRKPPARTQFPPTSRFAATTGLTGHAGAASIFSASRQRPGVGCSVYRASAARRRDWDATEDEIGQMASLAAPAGRRDGVLRHPRPPRARRLPPRRARGARPGRRRRRRQRRVPLRPLRSAALQRRARHPPDGLRSRGVARPAHVRPRTQRGQAIFVQPLGVVTRRSTDVLALGDADVSAAVRFIREHACDGIAVKDLLDRNAVVAARA